MGGELIHARSCFSAMEGTSYQGYGDGAGVGVKIGGHKITWAQEPSGMMTIGGVQA